MMGKILVSGLINMETTLRVDSFPLAYDPVRYPFFGVNTTVSGVGYNVAKALTTLGNEINFLSVIGQDFAADSIRRAMADQGIADNFIVQTMPATAQSVILYDKSGKRQIHADLKDIQDRQYPFTLFDKALQGCSMAILCNINYNRPFLEKTLQANIPVATDVHTISAIDDEYNQDYMSAATILFLSNESLTCTPEAFAQRLQQRYGTPLIVIGLGSEGALLCVRSEGLMTRFPAVKIRPIVNTIGAGDALFSSFVHSYLRTGEPEVAIKRAIVFASYKIGEVGAAEGFITDSKLQELCPVEN